MSDLNSNDNLPDGVDYCVMDYDLRDYNTNTVKPIDDRVTLLEKEGVQPGSGSILDLKGTPSEFPTAEECKGTDWITIVRSDGLYFRNPLTGAQKVPKIVSNRQADTPTSSHFLHLKDTPSSYNGHGGKLLAVGDFEDEVRFVDPEVSRREYVALLERVRLLEEALGTTPPSWSMTEEQEKAVLSKLSLLEEYWGNLQTANYTKATGFVYEDVIIRLNLLETYLNYAYTPGTPPSESHKVTEDEYLTILERLEKLELYWDYKP